MQEQDIENCVSKGDIKLLLFIQDQLAQNIIKRYHKNRYMWY